jgi:E3 ubiquitin-protein ligase MARCH5
MRSKEKTAQPEWRALSAVLSYLIVFPKLGPVFLVLDLADRLVSKSCPSAATGIMIGSISWTAVTYRAVTEMQVVGHKAGLHVMERADFLSI